MAKKREFGIKRELYQYTQTQVKEICWTLLNSIIEKEHLKDPTDYKEDFNDWFKNNAKPKQQ